LDCQRRDPKQASKELVTLENPGAGSFRYAGRHHLVMTGGIIPLRWAGSSRFGGRLRSESAYPAIGPIWRRAWEHVVPFFAFAPSIRKMIYTTNCVEALNRSLRKIIKTRGSFPNDEAALKLLYLAIKNAGLRWRRGIEWTAALGQLAIQFGDRFPGAAQ
jgi:Transposase, Mutator family